MRRGIMLFSVLIAMVSTGENLITNGSFEETSPITIIRNSTGVISLDVAGWRVYNTSTNDMTFEVISDEAVASEGTNYLKVTSQLTLDTSKNGGLDNSISTPLVLFLPAGETFSFSCDLQHVSGTNSILLVIQARNESQAVLENLVYTEVHPDTGDWTHYSYDITPENDSYFYVFFAPKQSTHLTEEVFLVDNVQLQVASGTSAVSNGGFEATSPMTVVRSSSAVTSFDIDGWRVYNTSTNDMTFEVISDETIASEGANYLKVTSQATSDTSKNGGVDNTLSLPSLSGGETYSFSCDLQHVSGVNSILLVIQARNENNSVLENLVYTAVQPGEGEWTHYLYDFTPANDSYLYIFFAPKYQNHLVDEVFLIDNVTVAEMKTPYEEWVGQYFTDYERITGVSEESVDSDGDGFSNWQEYIAATDPKDLSSVFCVSATCGVGSEYVLQWNAVSGRVYSVYSTSNLLVPFSSLQTNIVWPRSAYTNQVESEQFYKITVQIQ